ncbi:SGNH/GDSL hydrolase family protein [Flagellimonas myxillae]|uniref:SGNH/GDSL hydrolase family protein n=1 Tax=Flagellimonas myxillae TaxID=2942214 RepID=UPI00201F6C69|nr:SGNH/GDSL hydrolase family protein [Muricauda myxillae]MCL6268191.1 SGNH/GDSL hydrolase family protein [Muricauda myxillae]
MKKFYALLLPLLGLMIACEDDEAPIVPDPDSDPVVYTSGTANFANFVALGSSLTAGFSDNALFAAGQEASFPNMLAGQFALAGGGAFNQPLMADNLGGATLGGNPILGNRLILLFTPDGPAPTPKSGTGTTEISTKLSGSFNNMGIPGSKSYELLAPGYGSVAGVALGTANPYFARFSSAEDATVIGDAAAQGATFFSAWIGANDVLLYATSGGAGTDQTGNLDPTSYERTDITDPLVFGNVLTGILQTMTAGGADGVIANIPNILDAPFFHTVPFAPLDPTNPAFGPQIPVLNAQFAGLNLVFQALGVPERQFVFSESAASSIIIKDEDLLDLSAEITQALILNGVDAPTAGVTGLLYGQARQSNADDMITLPSSTVIATLNEEAFAMLQNLGLPAETAGQLAVNGITYPMEDQWVLTPQEQEAVATARDAYNQTIEALAAQFNLPMVDIDALLEQVSDTGFPLADGSSVTSTFATGGGFSLDGVHPTPRGYALIANSFIKVINDTYGSNLPDVNPLGYTGLYID